MTLIVIVIAFILIALVQMPKMVQQKEWRELVVYVVLFVPGFVFSILMGLDKPIYSPIKAIHSLIQMVVSIL